MAHFEHLVTTPVKQDSCKKCQMPIWTGWVGGILTHLDVEPIDLPSEILAMLARRATYQIKKHDRSFTAIKRDRYTITPNDHQHKIILQAHVCDAGTLISNGHPNYFQSRYIIEHSERPAF